ncbi:hypothetical protein J4427_00720 [Candidatus Woesearchaeota archaeon]|nr:hypothetical protein [Candidatus Woesearchaeota archaeon]
MDWLRIVFYIFVLIALFIYVKVSQIRINGRSMIKLKYRILLALFFPLLFVLFLLIGSIIVGIALTVLFILGIWILLSRLGYKRRK